MAGVHSAASSLRSGRSGADPTSSPRCYKRAQRRFDYASKIVKIGDGEEAQEISDEEFEKLEMREDDMPVTSLKELSESADQLEQRVKRPRKTIDEETAQPFLSKAGVS